MALTSDCPCVIGKASGCVWARRQAKWLSLSFPKTGQPFCPWLLCVIQVKYEICSLLSSFRRWPEQVSPGADSGLRASQEAPGGGICPGVQRGWLLYPGEALAKSLRSVSWTEAEKRCLRVGGPHRAWALWETAEGSLTPSVLPSGVYVPPPGCSTPPFASWQWILRRRMEVRARKLALLGPRPPCWPSPFFFSVKCRLIIFSHPCQFPWAILVFPLLFIATPLRSPSAYP